jgi:hypothetical protein
MGLAMNARAVEVLRCIVASGGDTNRLAGDTTLRAQYGSAGG